MRIDPMRFALLLPLLFLSGLAPGLAAAQSRGGDVVDLERVESDATQSGRSAFGRVMDVMIAALVEQQGKPEGAQPARRRATLALDSVPPRAMDAPRAQPRIDIALGERFALPPADAVSQADVPE